MKGYKGFEKGLICRGKKYQENSIAEESEAKICESGMHFCKSPHRVFEYYSPGENHEFAEVEALDEVFTDDNEKYCTKKLRIGAKISVFDICKISVNTYFTNYKFNQKISETKGSDNNNAGNCGAANAGNYGAANAGNCGAANAGYRGAANAGNYGAANAGNRGAANAGDCGAANAGNCGAAIVRKDGVASVGKCGVAIAFDGQAKGAIGAVIVLLESDANGNVKNAKSYIVDGEKVKGDTYYKLVAGELTEIEGK